MAIYLPILASNVIPSLKNPQNWKLYILNTLIELISIHTLSITLFIWILTYLSICIASCISLCRQSEHFKFVFFKSSIRFNYLLAIINFLISICQSVLLTLTSIHILYLPAFWSLLITFIYLFKLDSKQHCPLHFDLKAAFILLPTEVVKWAINIFHVNKNLAKVKFFINKKYGMM